MSQTIDDPQPKQTLEEELEELRSAEARLERKTKDMWSAEVAGLVVAFIALVVAAGALVAALTNDNGGTTTVMARSAGAAGAGASTGPAGMPAAGGSAMSDRSAPSGAAGARTVNVTLGEMYVKPSRTTISAGKVTFVAKNIGMLEHELMIEKMPIAMEGPGEPVEDAALGMIEEMGHLGTGKMTLDLAPGRYELFCNVSGHYAAGQHVPFTVTES